MVKALSASLFAITVSLCPPLFAGPAPAWQSVTEAAQVAPEIPNLRRVEFVFDNKVTQTKDLPTASLQAARKRMVSGGKILNRDLQALADHGDGLAAFRYARVLQALVPAVKPGAAAHYYAISAYTGRSFAVPPLAKLLVTEGAGYKPSLLTQCLNAMTIQAIGGNATAAQLLGQMYSDGVPFGRDLMQAQHFLSIAGKTDPAAALRLGMALLADPADIALDHAGAKAALELAASGENLSARVTAENILQLLNTPPSPIEKAAP